MEHKSRKLNIKLDGSPTQITYHLTMSRWSSFGSKRNMQSDWCVLKVSLLLVHFSSWFLLWNLPKVTFCVPFWTELGPKMRKIFNFFASSWFCSLVTARNSCALEAASSESGQSVEIELERATRRMLAASIRSAFVCVSVLKYVSRLLTHIFSEPLKSLIIIILSRDRSASIDLKLCQALF